MVKSSQHDDDGGCSLGGSLVSTFDYLEKLAEGFEERLVTAGLVQDRKTLLQKVISKCFVGKDAVTLIQSILQAECDLCLDDTISNSNGRSSNAVVSRADAVEKGRAMMQELNFFRRVSTCTATESSSRANTLEDSDTALYRFHHNLPSQVRRMKKKYPSYWDKMRLLEQSVPCQDRRHMFRVFPDCFVASEAVDALMELKLVKSRNEAVHLIDKLNQKVFCCQHVCSEHEFKDDYLFFRFVPENERMPEPASRPQQQGKSLNRSFTRGSRGKSPNRSLIRGSSLKKLDQQQEERPRRCRPKKVLADFDTSTISSASTEALSEAEFPSATLEGAAEAVEDPVQLQVQKESSSTRRGPNKLLKATCDLSVPNNSGQGKKVNQKKADEIKNRLALHKQETRIKQQKV
jgi:Domain found in Dishevelled, Egl-10, and Pleckstrin (DEP)